MGNMNILMLLATTSMGAASHASYSRRPRTWPRMSSAAVSGARAWKGYTKPGPLPAPAVNLTAREGETLDAICGCWRIFQLASGYRYNADDVLVAWYGSQWCASCETYLDLGSGIGSVALVTAWRLRGAKVVTVEAQEPSWQLSKRSVAFNGVSERFDQRLGDFREVGTDSAPLKVHEQFDLITGSPPYFPLSGGTYSPSTPRFAASPQRMQCHFETRGTVTDYVACASRHLAPGGVFALVFSLEDLSARDRRRQRGLDRDNGPIREGSSSLSALFGTRGVIEVAASQFGMTVVRMRRIRSKPSHEPVLGLFALQRTSDLPRPIPPTWNEPDLVMRTEQGAFTPEYAAIRLATGFHPQWKVDESCPTL